MLVFAGLWLLVLGYGLTFIGYKNLGGAHVSFQQAFFPNGLAGVLGPTAPAPREGTPAAGESNAPQTTGVQSRGSSQVVTV